MSTPTEVRSTADAAPLLLDELVFNGPIRTGWRIDLQRILAGGYLTWRRFWDEQSSDMDGWSGVFPRSRDNQLIFDADDYAGSGSPGYVARYEPGPDSPWHVALAHEFPELTIRHVHLDVYDFGIASLTVRADWRGLRTDGLAAAIDLVEQLSTRLSEESNPHIRAALGCLRDALEGDDVDWLRERETSLGALHGQAPPCCVQWMHRLLVFHGTASEREPYPDHDLFRHGQEMPDRLFRGGKLWIGHGTSLVISPQPGPAADRIAPMLSLANAFEAGCRELGGLVLKNQQDVAVLRRERNVDELEERAHNIVELHDELSLFRIMWREQGSLLPVDGRAIMRGFADTWSIEAMLDEIQLRGEDLSRLHDQALRRIQADEAGRLNRIVTALTFFSIAQVLAELVDFVNNDGDLFGFNGLRVAFLLMIAVFLAAWVLSGRRFRRGPRPPRGSLWARGRRS